MNHRISTSLCLLALTLVGCRGVHPPIEGRGDPFLPPQVTFATTDLRNRIAVGTPVVQRDDAGNLLHVTLPIRTDQPRPLYIDYRVTFVDRAGATLWQTGWMPKQLEANSPDSITVNSTNAAAADFNIAIRAAR